MDEEKESGKLQINDEVKIAENLEVVGNAHTSGNSQFDGNVVLGDADTDTVTVYGTVNSKNTTGSLEIAENLSVIGNVHTGGNVGIGTDSPAAKLDVAGDLKLSSGCIINEFSSDETLNGSSDLAVPTEKAVKTYVDNAVAILFLQKNGTIPE